MDEELKKTLSKTADTIRGLSMEAVQKANSGHPGLPMGCAELGAYLYGVQLKHNPKNPDWINRDRLILSAGHGSAWLYSCLHLAGFKMSIEDLKSFRQLHSITPGHPEFHETEGVESTTGPLGQGVANAVGQALAIKLLEERFNRPNHNIFDSKVYCLCGDGCLMEGVSHEACSLAGHLQLDNLVLIWDSNQITLDGPLSQSNSEHTADRFRAYGWDVLEMDGNNLEEIHANFSKIKESQGKPLFIVAKTIIGKGSPNKEGTHKAHGSPLGPEEVELVKKELGLPEEDFYVPSGVRTHFEQKLGRDQDAEHNWDKDFEAWKSANPDLATEFDAMLNKTLPDNLEELLDAVEMGDSIGGRNASQNVLQVLGDHVPFLLGGSADLSGSDCTMMKQFPLVAPNDFAGRNIKYGVREFGMAAAAAGIFQSHMFYPYVGTFLTFSDYMRNAIRLASLSHYKVIYQFTHDSIFLGEDGPTHQSIEQCMSLRLIPNLHVFRPGDANEVKHAWIAMLKYSGPSVIILTRQKLPTQEATKIPYKDGVGRGAYIVKKEKGKPDFTLFGTGSELWLALDVAAALEKMGKSVRVISMPCWELFEAQDQAYIDSVVGGELGKRVAIEAGIGLGWQRWVGPEGVTICMEGFGLSAPMADLANEFGFNVEAILERIL
ncbi:MAG: Transketolase [Chlamydiia bacterium]|nr:Transketolase [Chlamydiia bacterium]MCH9614968.1 Transketolase [Chlamydiia bacterium]MCH9629982.1 Transketolase [Chlamydiia bacterium]